MDYLPATIIAILLILFFFGTAWLIYSAFRTHPLWGIVCLLPLGWLLFGLMKPKESRAGCLIQVTAIFVFGIIVAAGFILDAIR